LTALVSVNRTKRPSRARATVEIVTARNIKGPKWISEYPDKANELWVIVHVAGRKKKKRIGPPTPDNRRRAERQREEWLAALNVKLNGLSDVIAPTFKEIGEAFSDRGLPGRAPKTQDGRRYQTNDLIEHFGEIRIDRISGPDVRRLWDEFLIKKKGLDTRTAGFYLDCLSLVFKFAIKKGHDVVNPVPSQKTGIMAEYRNTAEYRSRDERNKKPLKIEDMRAFLPKLAECDPNFVIWCLLMYEAGLRKSEAFGLRWGRCPRISSQRPICGVPPRRPYTPPSKTKRSKSSRLRIYPPIWYILLKLNDFNELQGSGGVSLCHVVR
jgi:hypothetical protein